MDIVTLAAARKGGGSGGDVTKQYVDDHLALKADKSETAEYPIASTTTGINPTITDSANGLIQNLTVYGRTDTVEGELHGIGEDGELEIATANSDNTASTSATITTGIPLYGIPVTTGETYTDEQGQKWLADTADVERVVKRTCKVAFDGSEDEGWARDGDSPEIDGGKRFYIYIDQTPKAVETTAIPSGVISGSVLQSASYTWSTGAGTSIAYNYIQVRVPNVSTIEGFKTYLASNPVTVVYELATPYEIPLTASEITQLRGLRTYASTTNVTITDAPTVDVGYLLNTANGKAVANAIDNAITGVLNTSY